MTAVAAFQTEVSVKQDLIVEWNKDMNRLRIADTTTGKNLAVYGNGEVYGVQPEAPAGQVVITVDALMPRIVESLAHAGFIRVTRKVYDPVVQKHIVTAEVLL